VYVSPEEKRALDGLICLPPPPEGSYSQLPPSAMLGWALMTSSAEEAGDARVLSRPPLFGENGQTAGDERLSRSL